MMSSLSKGRKKNDSKSNFLNVHRVQNEQKLTSQSGISRSNRKIAITTTSIKYEKKYRQRGSVESDKRKEERERERERERNLRATKEVVDRREW